MKKFITASFVLALALGFTGNAWAGHIGRHNEAPDRVGQWDMGVGIGGALNSDVDDSYFVSGTISYGVTPYIGLGVEAGWQEASGAAANDESIGAVPILFDIIVRVPTVHEALVPYGVLGLGVIGVYATNENGTGANQGADDYDTGFGWKLGGGIDYFLNERWIFNFEFAYFNADVNLPTSSVGDGFDFWTIGVALKYLF